jgi:hypothetical protein
MAIQKQDQEAGEVKSSFEEAERPAMPPGHPVAWQVLTEGTLLEGTAYPLPVFL